MRRVAHAIIVSGLVGTAALLTMTSADSASGVTPHICTSNGGEVVPGAMGTPGHCSGGVYDGSPIVRDVEAL